MGDALPVAVIPPGYEVATYVAALCENEVNDNKTSIPFPVVNICETFDDPLNIAKFINCWVGPVGMLEAHP